MSSNILYGYAYLKVNFDIEKKDAYDIVLPLAVRALSSLPSPLIAAPDLQKAIRSLWGLTIPENVLRHMLPRMADKGYLDRQSHAYLINRASLRGQQFEDREKAADRIYSRVRAGIAGVLAKHPEFSHDPDEVIENFLDTGAMAFLNDNAEIAGGKY